MRLVIPVEDTNGFDAKLSRHFGRANFFAVVDLVGETKISFERNVEHEEISGRGRRVSQKILDLKPDVLIVHQIGPGALAKLKDRVKIYKAEGRSLKEVISAFVSGKLRPVTEAECEVD
uniref:Dinitrogenase iron-molybdenum cofactor biosynthesis protein n=1 Tax=Archaeoglobus fulgidus TaxID=2234 RepID=A0A7J2TJZ1_ARCFL